MYLYSKLLKSMRKIATFFILIFIAKQGISQDQAIKKFRFGLKIAPNISWYDIKSPELTNNGNKAKFGYGLITEYNFSTNYALATGFELLTSGGKLDYPINSYYLLKDDSKYYLTNRTFNLNYLQIPTVLKMKTNEIGYFTYYGQFGFNTLFRTSAMADDFGINNKGSLNRSQIDITEETNFINLGLNVALGFEYNLYKETSMITSIGFNKGFTNCLKKTSKTIRNNDSSPLSQQVYSYFISLNIGILF